ncbi:MAG: hypothetical protein CMP22_07270 [Rickettsiales bacterium]|nr:hypothetical protein [Rickettsiales bacterium]
MIINAEALSAINKNFKSLYDAAFSKADPKWDQVAMKVNSTSSANVYGWLGASSHVKEWLGDRVIQNLKTHNFTIENKSFESTVAVDRDDIEDDNLGVYSPLVDDIGNNAANFPDELVFGVLKDAFTTLCYDGQYLIDTDHPVIDKNGQEQSVSNHGGGASNPWFLIDDTKSIKPIIFQMRKEFQLTALDNPTDPNVFMKNQFIYGIDGRMNVGVALWQLIQGSKQTLDATAYQARRTAMMNLTGDNGRPLRLKPSLLVVGPSNEQAAKDILEAEKLANGATNTNRNTAKLLVVPELG